MKIADWYKAVKPLELNGPVTITFRSNWQGVRHNSHKRSGTFAFLLEEGKRIKLWECEKTYSYRSIISITKG